MLISIFSPTQNRATTFVPELLASIEAQIIPAGWSLEWVVCDDGSTAEDLAQLKTLLKKSHIKTVLIEHKTSQGVSESRNDAHNSCSGEYILDVDDDDILTSDAVQLRVNHLIDTGALWSFTNAVQTDEDGRVIIGKEFIENWNHNLSSPQTILDYLLTGKAWFWASTRTYKKGALHVDGAFIGWDPKYRVAQDLEHWIALTNAIGPPVHLNAITAYWRGKQYSHGINGKRSGLQAELIADIRERWSHLKSEITS